MRSIIRRSLLLGSLIPLLSAAATLDLKQGWNLVGNSDTTSMAASKFADPAKFNTVWKWNKESGSGKWAFYAPSFTSSELAAYAAGKGYDVLTSIDPKEGFWVNAVVATTLNDTLATPPTPGSTASTLQQTDLIVGWNLVASADKKIPFVLNNGLNPALNAAGKGISTLWAWDASSLGWRFYAPSLEAQGGTVLSSYITSKSYLPFNDALSPTDGFWVNVGTVTPTAIPPAVPSASLRFLDFVDASNWSMRVFSSTAAQNTPSTIDGNYRYREMQMGRDLGTKPYKWTRGSSPRRGADLSWNGSDWVNCQINHENTISPSDGDGKSTYNYCDNLDLGTSTATPATDVSGRSMFSVYNEILGTGNTNITINAAANVLGAATFPAGSKFNYRSSTSTTSAVGYLPGSGDRVALANAPYVSGDATSCNSAFPGESPANTLENMIAAIKGKPCIYGEDTTTGVGGIALTSGPRNDAWGSASLSLGTVGSAPTYSSASLATSYYTGNTRLRVAFGAGNAVNYYSCQERWNGSTRNCNLIGSGTYSIQTLGDARTMRFSGLPSAANSLTWERVFVERGGFVSYGYQGKEHTNSSARLNLPALNALFTQLGMMDTTGQSTLNLDSPIVLSSAAYEGTYNGTFSGRDSGTFSVSPTTLGTTTCSGKSVAMVTTSNSTGAFFCVFSINPQTNDSTKAAFTLNINGTQEQFTGTVNYYTGNIIGTWLNSVTSVNGGSFLASRM